MYDYIFCGGGLSTLMLLDAMGSDIVDKKILVIEANTTTQDYYISYWLRDETPYDKLALARWHKACSSENPPEDISPYTISLLTKQAVTNYLHSKLKSPSIEWRTERVTAITSNADYCAVQTSKATYKASLVFDACLDVTPQFPAQDSAITLSGFEIVIEASEAVFDATVANLYIPLGNNCFGYLLPISATKALLETARFGSKIAITTDSKLALAYIQKKHPNATFTIHSQRLRRMSLGLPLTHSTGERHILIGQKRGLVKVSAGYGFSAIYRESQLLASKLRAGEKLQTTKKSKRLYGFMDDYFLRLAMRNPKRLIELIEPTITKRPITESMQLIDENLTRLALHRLMLRTFPKLF